MNTVFSRLDEIYPSLSFIFEQCLFDIARKFIPTYDGGHWISEDIGNNTLTLVYPADDDAQVDVFNTINCVRVETDPVSVGVCLTIITLSVVVEKIYGRVDDGQVSAIVDMIDMLKDAAYSNETLDKRSIFRIID